MKPFYKESYTNNYLYYCYNRGKVSGTSSVASMAGEINYLDINYVYSLTGTASGNWASVGKYKNADHQGMLDKSNLTSTVLSNFGSNFKSDYTDKNSINDGYPILSWQ